MTQLKTQNSRLTTAPPFAVIILGAGASSRMGRPKLLLPWGNTSIIGHLIEQWRALAAAQITVVRRRDDGELDAELDRLGFPRPDRIENPRPDRGMFGSIVCAARWDGWKEGVAAWAIVLGDQPHLRLATLRALLAFHGEHVDSICQPVYGGHARHPVFLPRRVFAELKGSSAGTLKDFLKPFSSQSVQCPMDDSGLALDLDRPEDYERTIKSHLGNV